jgi:chromosome segregation protein
LYITQLEIDNFKSFQKKTKIPFYEGFTVISGPNGSGKSNIIDSILFCLALSSARNLRAEKLTDFINLNSGKNTAEVEITFSDGTKVRRKIKRTAHGYYSYNYLNDRLCKQADIIEFLEKYGIKPEGYNVVMQGDITRIMEMSNTERRKIIDEIAGVAEFDKKRDQALNELEVVRERIEREELLLRELDARMEELKREREQALKYRELQDQIGYFQNCWSAAKLRERSGELGALQGLQEDQQKKIQRIQEQQKSENCSIDDLNAQIGDVDIEINEKSGSEYLALITEIEGAKSDIKLNEQTIERLKKERESSQETIKRLYMDKKRAETRVGECAVSVRDLSIDRSNLSMEVASLRANLEVVEEALTRESREVAGSKEQLFALMKQLEEEKGKRSELLHRQDVLIEKSRMRTSEKERLERRIAQIEDEIKDKREQSTEFESCLHHLQEEKKMLESTLAKRESSLFAQRSALERVNDELKTQERDLMRLEAQQQARGDSGGRALEAILGMDGVYGTIAQLGKAPPDYAVALDIAAGARLKYVVVETDAVAAGAIGYLKENRLGRLTFLPLNKLKAPTLEKLKDPEIIAYAVNLLDYDPMFDTAFRQVFSDTVVVETLERARKKMGKYRMVTLDGDLVEKGGAMTGGSRQKKISGFGVAVDEELAQIRARISGLQEEASEIQIAISRQTKECDEHRGQRSGIEEQILRYRMLSEEYAKRIEDLNEEHQGIMSSLSSMKADVRSGGDELADLEEQIKTQSTAISAINEDIESLKKRLEDTEIPALSEKMERLQKEIEENERRLRNKDADIADAQRERQYFSKRLEELENERVSIAGKTEQIDIDVAAAVQAIEGLRSRIGELEQKQQTFSKELDMLRQRRNALADVMKGHERRLIELEGEIERVRLQMATMEEKVQALLKEIEGLKMEVGDTETDMTLEEIEGGIERTERAIKRIGAVNMLAIEEYERVQTRARERTEKKDVLSRERTTLIERIERFEQMKYESFMTAFRAIDDNFRIIYARLTNGSGRLVVENEEDPFSGGMTFAVKPRDKKVHLLSSLSGGEKSITTLAFMFSVQQYMPAPFYALDEIDMFLDASNVERIGTMIKELSQNAQSIIVSLRKPTIERADRIIGVTLKPDKSTYVTGVKSNA